MRRALVVLLLVFGACTPSTPGEPRTWPAGTVFAIEDEPIQAQDVDQWLDTFRLIEPSNTKPSLRRKIFANMTLPLSVGRQLDPAKREAARARALEVAEQLRSDAPPAPERVTGTWKDLGLHAWGTAQRLPAGEWSDVLETVGQFYLIRTVALPSDAQDPTAAITVDRFAFPYIEDFEPKQLLESGIDSMTLTIVDPEWDEIIPEHYKFRMQVTRGSVEQ